MPRISEDIEQVFETAFVPLTQGDIAAVDATDLPLLKKMSWNSNGRYAMSQDPRTHSPVYMHRLLLGLAPGDGFYVDHINGDTLDNRRANLRKATMSENLRNMRKATPHSSRYKGVSLCKRTSRWQANAHLNYKKHFLGSFDNEADAARAYDAFALQHFGPFAKINAA